MQRYIFNIKEILSGKMSISIDAQYSAPKSNSKEDQIAAKIANEFLVSYFNKQFFIF